MDHPYYSEVAGLLLTFSGFLYEIPVLYLFSLLTLNTLIFITLFYVYKALTQNHYDHNAAVLICIFSILFFTIGGAGRLQFGNTPITGGIDLHIRSWSQVLLLFSLLQFIKQRYFQCSLLISITCFFHLLLALNLFAVLLTALILGGREFKSSIFKIGRLAIPVLLVVVIQLVMMNQLTPQELIFGSSKSASVVDWYQYIYKQDPDDMSLAWNLDRPLGLSYVAFQFFGLYFAIRTEKIEHLKDCFRNPLILLCLSSYAYLTFALLIEQFQSPDFLLEKLIALQPRRIAYFPVMILCLSTVKYIFNFVWYGNNIRPKDPWILLFFFAWFFYTIYMSNDEVTLSTKKTLVFFVVAVFFVVGTRLYYKYFYSGVGLAVLHNFHLISLIGIFVIFARTIPYLNASVAESLWVLHGSLEPHKYVDYIIKERTLLGSGQRTQNILSAGSWIRNHSAPNTRVLSIDFHADEIGHLIASSQRAFFQSLDLRYYRGPGMGGGYFATHYDFKSYQKVSNYFQNFLGVPMGSISVLDRESQLTRIHRIVTSFTRQELGSKESIFGERFDYVISQNKITNFSPVIYSNKNIFIYKL